MAIAAREFYAEGFTWDDFRQKGWKRSLETRVAGVHPLA